MSKKKKNLKWFWTGKEIVEREEAPVVDKKIYSKKIVDEYYDEDDYDDYNDGLGWEDKWDSGKKNKSFDWSEYDKSGKWGGYTSYRTTTLSYSYIMQMANAIAANNNVTIKTGPFWEIDLEKSTLTYNPTTMMFSSKGELIAHLLHEVGKIRLCTHSSKLNSSYLKKYDKGAYEVITAYDDFRVDSVMIDSYPSASEIYESQEAILDRTVEGYLKMADFFRDEKRSIFEQKLYNINYLIGSKGRTFQDAYEQVFFEKPKGKVNTVDKLKQFFYNEFVVAKPSIYDFIPAAIHQGYGLTNNKGKLMPEMITRFELTAPAIPKIVKVGSTQEAVDIMETEVFPHVKDLLETTKKGTDEMKEAFGEALAEAIQNEIDQNLQNLQNNGEIKDINLDSDGEQRSKGSNGGKDEVPKEWSTGDYSALKDSVSSEIKSLYNKLLNLRKKEQTIKYLPHQRRGKLNTKSLYQFSTGVQTLFRKRIPTVDTIRSFTFSILVDNSGSMDENHRNIHATRGLIMLSEVFKKMDMPFEIIHFDDSAHKTKKFKDKYDTKVQTNLSKYATKSGGGTQMEVAIKDSELLKQPESNKIMIALTDGGMYSHDEVEYEFEKLSKEGVKIIPIGLECGDEVKKLARGTGISVSSSGDMPQVFYDMLKKLIFKR